MASMDNPNPVLEDGSAPASAEELLRYLGELEIKAETVEHRPVFTVEEAKAHRGQISGGHTKNLFLRNKKGKMWLVVCLEDRVIDLKSLGRQIGSGNLSFCSAERLMKYLGVIPGAVTPFGLFNDKGGKVQVVLDRGVLEREPLNFHPLDNAMTTSIGANDFIRFLESQNHAPTLINIDQRKD